MMSELQQVCEPQAPMQSDYRHTLTMAAAEAKQHQCGNGQRICPEEAQPQCRMLYPISLHAKWG